MMPSLSRAEKCQYISAMLTVLVGTAAYKEAESSKAGRQDAKVSV